MKYYDIVVSLGEACYVTGALHRSNLHDTYRTRYPLDWTRGILWDKCGRGGLAGRIDHICNKFQLFFNLEDLEDRGPDPGDQGMLWIMNKRTGFSFRHDFKTGTKIEEAYPEVKARYDKSVKDFYEDIYHSDKVLFIYMAQIEGFSDDYLLEQAHRLQKNFPEQRIDVLYIMHKTGLGATEYTEEKLDQGVQRIYANMKYTTRTDAVGIGLGNIDLYDKILRKYCTPLTFLSDENEQLRINQYAALKSECDALKSKLDFLQQQQNTLSNENESHEQLRKNQYAALKSEYGALKSEYDELESEQAVQKFKLNSLSLQQNDLRTLLCQSQKDSLRLMTDTVNHQLFHYYVASHKLYYYFKLIHMQLKQFFHRGKKREKYKAKCRLLIKLIKTSKKQLNLSLYDKPPR